MRLLDRNKIKYESFCYENTGAISGEDVANVLGQDPNEVFKTLVTVGKSGKNYVFVIPSCCELDLKKAAENAGEKSIAMLKSKELLPLTGYIHGGCSPIGMKKFFPTYIDSSAENFDAICMSAGKIGYQVKLSLSDLGKMIKFSICDLTVDS